MPIFQFTATDQSGAPSEGTFEAANEEQAYAQLAQYGLTVSKVVPLDAPTPAQVPPAVAAEEPAPTKSGKPTKKSKEEKEYEVQTREYEGTTRDIFF